MRIGIVQLSDLHISGPEHPLVSRADEIAAALQGGTDRFATLFVVVAGDVANKGRADEYYAAKEFFTTLLQKLRTVPAFEAVEIVVAPGNHDCFLGDEDDVRDAVIAAVRKDPNKLGSAKTVAQCTEPQANYRTFAKAVGATESGPLATTQSVTVGERTVRVVAYNTAYTSVVKELHGQLSFPPAAVVGPVGKVDLALSVFHHPYSWLAPENARPFRQAIERTSDLVLTGHEHVPEHYQRRAAAGTGADYYEGASLYDEEGNSAFTFITIDLDERKHRAIHYRWSDLSTAYERIRTGEWLDLLRGRGFADNGFHPSREFLDELDDTGLPFTHSRSRKQKIQLADLYVMPTFRYQVATSRADKLEKFSGGKEVLGAIWQDKKILIHGEEACGKTSFGKAICRDALDRGLVPLTATFAHFDDADPDLVAAAIDRRVERNYSASHVERFRRLERERKVLVLDDWHRSKLSAKDKSAVLKALGLVFEFIVIVGDDILRVEGISHRDVPDNELLTYRAFQMMELGREGRTRLIEKWLALGPRVEDEHKYVKTVALRRRFIDALLGRNLIPAYPLFILVLLQQMEAASSLDTATGSFGYFYEAMLTAALTRRGANDLDTKFGYLSELAFAMFTQEVEHLSESELRAHHDRYRQKYAIAIDHGRFRDELIEADILLSSAAGFSFKYRYIYYYFTAKYLAREDALRRETIERLALTVHNEEHANILIFLSYLSRDPHLIRTLLERARNLYAAHEPCTLEQPLTKLRALTDAVPAPVLVLPSGPTSESEMRCLARADLEERTPTTSIGFGHVEGGTQEDEEREAQNRQAEEIIRINMALKALQILGQILRNFPGTLQRDVKYEIAHECYQLGLRTLTVLFTFIESNAVLWLEHVEKLLRQANPHHMAARELARDAVWTSTEQLALGMLKRIATAVGHDRLGETYDEVLSKNDVVAVRLVDLAIKLDCYDSTPEKDILTVHKKTGRHAFARKLLRWMVWEHLCLYPGDYRQRQRLCKAFDIQFKQAEAQLGSGE